MANPQSVDLMGGVREQGAAQLLGWNAAHIHANLEVKVIVGNIAHEVFRDTGAHHTGNASGYRLVGTEIADLIGLDLESRISGTHSQAPSTTLASQIDQTASQAIAQGESSGLFTYP